MSREDEVAQGLRHEDGGLVGGLDILDCIQASEDFRAGRAPPRITSASYDVWRARLAREASERHEVRARFLAEQMEQRERMRRILAEANRPDLVAEYDAKMAEIDARYSRNNKSPPD